MSRSLTIRAGDKVQVISGKDKGKEGKVLRAFPEKQRVIVERVNLIKKHTRPSQRYRQGGIVELEGTIHVSNLMLVCPTCGQPTRVGRKREDGVRLRVCKKCGKEIDR